MNIWVQVSRVLESMEAPDRSSRYRPESRRLQQVVRHIICAVHEFQSIRAPASTLFLSGTEDPIKIAERVMICFDRYYKSLIRTKATSPISLPARQATY